MNSRQGVIKMSLHRISMVMALIGVLVFVSFSEAAPATQPVSGKVLKVIGRVQHKLITGKKWSKTRVGDVLSSGMEIRTGLRSSVVVKLHTSAVVQVKSATRIAFTELSGTPKEDKTRITLSYGAVRAGIISDKVRSDFKIACPTAVLSREGTWGMEMSYDPATGGYRIGLDTKGLVRALRTKTGRQMTILPGQFVTNQMQQWVQTASFARMVTLVDPFGVTKVERKFYVHNSGGLAGADPTGPQLTQQGFTKDKFVVIAQQRAIKTVIKRQIRTNIQNLIMSGDGKIHQYRFGNFGTHVSSDTNIWSANLKRWKIRR